MYVKRIQGAICSPNSFEVWRSSDAIWKQTKMQAFQSQHDANQHLRSWSASDQSTLFKRETKKQHTSQANFAISPMSSFESPPFQNSKWTLQNTQINPPFGIPGIFPPPFFPRGSLFPPSFGSLAQNHSADSTAPPTTLFVWNLVCFSDARRWPGYPEDHLSYPSAQWMVDLPTKLDSLRGKCK